MELGGLGRFHVSCDQVTRLLCGAALVALATGCGGVVTVVGTDEQGQGVNKGPPGETPAALHDCNTGAGYELTSFEGPSGGVPAVRIVGIYEARSDHSGGYHPTGDFAVHVEKPGSVVLVLSSYEPTHWTVTAADDAIVDGVILNGYHAQTATAPAGAAVTDLSGEGNYLSACAYAWPGDDQGCDTQALVAGAEAITGQKIASFDGCYDMTYFTFADEQGD